MAGDQDLAVTPGLFEAPAWLPDGTIIVVDAGEAQHPRLYRAGSAGQPGEALTLLDGGAMLDLSPDGKRLAYAAQSLGDGDQQSKLYVLDLARSRASPGGAGAASTTDQRSISGDDFVAAFFWAPDGSHIAYFVPSVETGGAQGPGIQLTLKVVQLGRGAVHSIATFRPSPFFLGLLKEFGQYAESVHLWSPDSRFLVYSAEDANGPGIMVAYANQPITPRRIATGMMATWSSR